MNEKWAYLLLNVLSVLTVITFCDYRILRRNVSISRIITVFVGLFLFWTVVDIILIRFGFWYFPEENTLNSVSTGSQEKSCLYFFPTQ